MLLGQQTFLIINQHALAWSMVAPASEYQVETISSGSRRETLNVHTRIPSRDQPVSEVLRRRYDTRPHFPFPVPAKYVICLYCMRFLLCQIQRVEYRLDTDFVGAQRDRLQWPSYLAGFSHGCNE